MAKCDIPNCSEKATYDAKLRMGPWAFVCNFHFKTKASGLAGTYTELREE